MFFCPIHDPEQRTVAYGLLALLAVAAVLLTVDLRRGWSIRRSPRWEVVDTVPAVPTAYGSHCRASWWSRSRWAGRHLRRPAHRAGVPYPVIDSLVRLGEGKFDVRRMRQGNPIAFVYTDDDQREPRYFVYEVDPWSTWCSR